MNIAEVSDEACNDRPVCPRAADFQPLPTAMSLELREALAEDSHGAFRRFLELALRLCNAGSAGLSLLRTDGAGRPVMRWELVSGALAVHQGLEAPRNVTPCGHCLDNAATTLLVTPEREYSLLKGMAPPITEDLLVPLCDSDRVSFGTLWIAHHDATLHFGEGEVRTVERLARLLVRVFNSGSDAAPHQCALRLLESHLLEMNEVASELAAERGRREQAEASASKMKQSLAFKDAAIQDAHHRVKNTIQIAASVLQLQARRSDSAQVSAALQQGYGRLHVLAEVHELLHQNARQAIPMPALLYAIAAALDQSGLGEEPRVKVHAVCVPIILAADDAIPLALFVNEALTNACKHAFRAGRAGEVRVTLQLIGGCQLVLQVRDDGVGLQGTPGPGLGLQLMRSFAEQLGGTLDFGTSPDSTGTELTLTVMRERGWELSPH